MNMIDDLGRICAARHPELLGVYCELPAGHQEERHIGSSVGGFHRYEWHGDLGKTAIEECKRCSMEQEVQRASAEQETWVLSAIELAIQMAIALEAQNREGGQELLVWHGQRGVAEGAAINVLRVLGFEPRDEVLLRKRRTLSRAP